MSIDNARFALPGVIERCFATLSVMYANQGKTQLGKIIVNAKYRIHEESSSSDWNGISTGHTLYLTVPKSVFPSSGDDKTKIQNMIREDLNKIHNIEYEFIEAVFLEMETQQDRDWRKESGMQISAKRIIPVSVQDRIWGTEGYYRVFLTHKSEVKKETALLKSQLKVYGISGFVAHEDIQPTKEWQTEIENALSSMDALVALMTEKFHDSEWTDQEIGFAFGRSVPIISIRLGKDPYGFIGKFQALPCAWDTAALEIAKILIKQDGMLNAYIKAVQDCGSFEDGNSISVLLSLIEKLSTKQISDLVAAYNSNGNVKGSYGFNGRNLHFHGTGLLPHLARWTGKQYKFSRDGNIEIQQ